MQEVPTLSQLNNPAEIKKVVSKLPFKFRDRWREQVFKIKDSAGIATFSDLCDFVQMWSDIMDLPIYGEIAEPRPDKNSPKKVTFDGKRNTEPKQRVYSSQVNKDGTEKKAMHLEKTECMVCKKTNHRLANCLFLQAKPYEEREELIKRNSLCFGCLGKGHFAKNCKERAKCIKCEKNHPTALHREVSEANKFEGGESQNSEDENDSEIKEVKSCTSVLTTAGDHSGAGVRVLLPAIPVKLRMKGSSSSFVTYMGLDSFCSDVFMNKQLLAKMGIGHVESAPTSLTTMCCKNRKTDTVVLNDLEILDLDENYKTVIPVTYCKDNWPFDKEDTPKEKDIDDHPHLRNLPLNLVDEEIGILIGVSQPHLFKVLETVEGPNEDSIYATRHKLGWALNGPTRTGQGRGSSCFLAKQCRKEHINKQFEEFCSSEFRDLDGETLAPSVEDIKWKQRVQSSLRKLPDGHYEVGLPFRDELACIPNNKSQALSRLNSMRRKLQKNREFYEEYIDFMQLMMDSKFAEVVPEDEILRPPGKSWYLVHFGVHHKQKKKLRIVFDASLKYKGVSLNDMLYQGPDLVNNLIGVLLRFRQERVAIAADIRKMFYQIRVSETDQDYLRFLWYPNGDLSSEPREYRITVHVFGAISSPSIANFVLQHLPSTGSAKEFSTIAKQTVAVNFYVDDMLKSVLDENSAISLMEDVRGLVATGGFQLVEIASNARKVLKAFSVEDLTKEFQGLNLDLDELPQLRALGIGWQVENDHFVFEFNPRQINASKRGILSVIHSIYDPLGMLAPVVVPAKRIFQRSCSENLDWDQELPLELKRNWNVWYGDLAELRHFRANRCYKLLAQRPDEVQLHMFCDGSEVAYAAIAYLRFSFYELDRHTCYFVAAKTCLVPLKTSAMRTIPRIELSAAKLATILSLSIRRELEYNIDRVIFWSDSLTVLKYISNESKHFHRYVANRTAFIREHTDPQSWQHVPGSLNPSDVASRGCSMREFLQNREWLEGSEFLWKAESEWPELLQLIAVDNDDPEVPKCKVMIARTQGCNSVANSDVTDDFLSVAFTWYKVRKAVAFLIRIQKGEACNNAMTPEELQSGEVAIWKFLQNKFFADIINQLKEKRKLT